jgi:hypothetical protein
MRKLRGQQGDYKFNPPITRQRMRMGGQIPLRGDEINKMSVGSDIPLRGDEIYRVRGRVRKPFEMKPSSMAMTNATTFKKHMTDRRNSVSGGIKKINGIVMGDIKRPL